MSAVISTSPSNFAKEAGAPRQPRRLLTLSHSTIDNGDIDIWYVDLDQADQTQWRDVLTASDWARAERYVHLLHRNRFAQARFSLRILLGAYCAQPPDSLKFINNTHGKPALTNFYRLSFNLSRSGNIAVIAIGRQLEIGVDIEQFIAPNNPRELARTVFSEEENNAFSGLPDDVLARTFLTCWTRKEAYLKAIGTGLVIDPRHVTVGLQPHRQPVADIITGGIVEVATLRIDTHAVISLAVAEHARSGYRQACMRHFSLNEMCES